MSGERLAALVKADEGKLWNFLQVSRPIGHAEQGLDDLVEWMDDFLKHRRSERRQ